MATTDRRRRHLLKLLGTAGIGGLAGCSTGDTQPESEDYQTATDESGAGNGASGDAETEETPSDSEPTTDSDASGRSDPDETQPNEQDIEQTIDGLGLHWFEFEDPPTQIPTERYSKDQFPVVTSFFEAAEIYADDLYTAYIAPQYENMNSDLDPDSQHFFLWISADREGEFGNGVSDFSSDTPEINPHEDESEPKLFEFFETSIESFTESSEDMPAELLDIVND